MLTATYAIVAMSVEQAELRASLHGLQELVRTEFRARAQVDAPAVEHTRRAMERVLDAFRWRKVEQFLVPALSRATRACERLLAELDGYRLRAAEALAGLGNHALGGAAEVARFCGLADVFCAQLLQRLEREERDLLPVARAVLSSQDWFDLANPMLARGPRPPTRERLPELAVLH